jgi:O-acetylserine/cysteine efflux transporter
MKFPLTLRDAGLALAVVSVWGINFVVTKLALGVVPPFTMASLRFFFVVFPAIFFVKRPRVSWSNLAGYGFFITFVQFSALLTAMNGLLSPGLTSLICQTQAFFFVGLAMLRHGERLNRLQYIAFATAIAGIGLIMAHNGPPSNGQGATLAGVGLALTSAFAWAIGNQFSKEVGPVDPFAYVVWGNVFGVPLLVLAAFLIEGPGRIGASLAAAGPGTWAAIFWQTIGNTMFGYSVWAFLIRRYRASIIAPFSLLVPLVAMAASALVLGELLEGWKLAATGLVLGGLALNLIWSRRPDAPAEI